MIQSGETKPSFMPLELATPRIRQRALAGGGFILESEEPLGAHADHLGQLLQRQAERQPQTVFLAEKVPTGGWRKVSYGDAWDAARSIAQGLLDRGLDQSTPIAILSGNSIDHALLMLGGFVAGVPVTPVSVAYSLMSGDFAKVHHIVGLVKPRLIFAQGGGPFEKVLATLPKDIETITDISALRTTEPTPAADARFNAIRPDWVAKYLFTSGSTGLPKGVINTHRMLCSNQQAIAQIWPFLQKTPPVLLDWLPWNHTFGGNHNFNMVLRQGGTLYIDDGKPAPGLVDRTVANLSDVSPTIYFNVPAGYAMLIPHLEKDAALCERFFRRLQMIFYAGAALPPDLWARLEALSIRTLGKRVIMTSSWGSTETSPLATAAHYPIERAGVIGVPVPGVQLKFVPSGSKLEIRVKGPNVTPGYLGSEEQTRKAFDEDGFYCIGDAARLADESDPAKGVVFDGRTAEDFKLTTGTWVHVGGVRVAALAACSPLLQDAVVTGQDRSFIGLLAWASAAAKDIAPEELRRQIAEKLALHNKAQGGASSLKVQRVILLSEPPSIDANEITDKGYINQRATLERRHADVMRIYADPPASDVIAITD
ncbi:feruloyl-CoA synthase [Ferrovibrio sp.]|uniref:feruloyl-CoA synthase n=1 Tax=Ferrovibrio sp. TaxID=1917215 RepID=UPI000CC06F3C|nr:feruloyl-CoA synthase [Ferrovibrio sp.]PJI39473.1 MAG: feruloyl-CoA synthase [Ferrovibrio sp.]